MYHWKDAIGPKNERKPIENLTWGNVREDNSFGTNEFLKCVNCLVRNPIWLSTEYGTVKEAVRMGPICESC